VADESESEEESVSEGEESEEESEEEVSQKEGSKIFASNHNSSKETPIIEKREEDTQKRQPEVVKGDVVRVHHRNGQTSEYRGKEHFTQYLKEREGTPRNQTNGSMKEVIEERVYMHSEERIMTDQSKKSKFH